MSSARSRTHGAPEPAEVQTELPLGVEGAGTAEVVAIALSNGTTRCLVEPSTGTSRRLRPNEFTHGLHSYPAKFIPQLQRVLSERSREPGDLIVDPFSGGGTTGVEVCGSDADF